MYLSNFFLLLLSLSLFNFLLLLKMDLYIIELWAVRKWDLMCVFEININIKYLIVVCDIIFFKPHSLSSIFFLLSFQILPFSLRFQIVVGKWEIEVSLGGVFMILKLSNSSSQKNFSGKFQNYITLDFPLKVWVFLIGIFLM